MVTPGLNRQTSIKKVREIKETATSLQKKVTFVPI